METSNDFGVGLRHIVGNGKKGQSRGTQGNHTMQLGSAYGKKVMASQGKKMHGQNFVGSNQEYLNSLLSPSMMTGA